MPEPIVTPPEPQQAERITFTDAQQARISEIVKEVSARSGLEARTEAERLRTELAASKSQAPGNEDVLALATARAELTSLKAAQAETSVKDVLRTAVGTATFFDPELAAQILRSSIRVIDGRPVVIDGSGNARLNGEFNPMTPAELAQELATSKPFLVRGTVAPGLGSSQRQDAVSHTTPLETLFGRSSNGGEANRLAMRNPREYSRLRAQARERGLL